MHGSLQNVFVNLNSKTTSTAGHYFIIGPNGKMEKSSQKLDKNSKITTSTEYI
jgi:hypothetical protein